MNTNGILAELRAERDRLDGAIAALESLGSPGEAGARRGAPAGRGRRRLSAAARARISAAQKARWAKQKGSSPKLQNKTAGKRRQGGISPAGRKRLSEMMKRRWALRRQGKSA